MRRSSVGRVLIVSVCIVSGLAACAQTQNSAKETPVAIDLAVTYSPERAQLAQGSCGCFWLQGAGMDAAVNFRKGFGVVASISGAHASNVAPGVDVNRIVALAGGRYTHSLWGFRKQAAQERHLEYFGQWLFGGDHAFNGIFPSGGGIVPRATAFAMQGGGGMNMALNEHFGLRLLEVEYLRSTLPNNGSNTQNDLRLAFGVTYRFKK